MAEKILNTRIALKIDTLENWNSSTIGLKKGELAIATVAATAGTGLAEPVVMIKVGEDGIKTFTELPWSLHAKASDVLAVCKNEDTLKEFINGVIADAGIASDDAIEALAARVTDNEDAIELLNGNAETAGSVAKSIKDAIDALKLDATYEKVGTAQGIVDTLNVTDTAVTGQYVSAVSEEKGKITVTRADLPTYTLASGSANGTVAFNGADVAVTGLGSAAYTDTKAYEVAGAAATAKSEAIADAEGKINDLRDGAVKDNADAIAAIKDHTTVDSFNDVMTEMAKYQLAGDYATKAEAQGYADAKDTAIAEAKKAGTDAAAALETYKTSNNAAVALKADQSALEAEITRAQKAEKDNADAIKLLTDGVDQEKVDGVKDLIDYVETHGPEVTAMKEDISENTTAITNEATRAVKEEERLAGLIDDNAEAIKANADAIAALNAADGKVANATYADKANSLTDSAKEEVKEVKVDNATHADSADKIGEIAAADVATITNVSTAKQEAIDTAANDATTKADKALSDAQDYADSLAKNYATAAQGALADSAVQKVTVLGKELTNGGSVSVDEAKTALGLGSAAYTEASAYATSAQGAKADSALQSVEVGTGLKVSEKANNKQTIEIDEDVIFIFNGGTASTVI